jgi:N-acetylneuraminic acid mutarotase
MSKFKICYFLIPFLLFACVNANAQNNWSKRESVGGSKRERAVSFSIGNRGYVALGQDTNNLMLNDLWEYDPGTNSWMQKANFIGVGRRDAIAFSIGTKGYVGTGKDNADSFLGNTLSNFYEYDPGTNVWTMKAAYPGNSGMGIYYATGFSLLGKGYVCCGKSGPSSYSNELWQYNPSTNSWLSRASFIGGPRYGGAAFVIGSYAYFGTGADENVYTQDFYRYDPALNAWTIIAPFPGSGRFACCTFTLDNNGYLLFGTDGGYKDELWQYDPTLNYWVTKSSFPGGERKSGIALTIGTKAYAGTGKSFTGVRRDFYEYSSTAIIGIHEIENNSISSIYPVPVTYTATVKLSDELFTASYKKLTWELVNIEGKILKQESITGNEISFQRDELPSGVYFFSIKSESNTIACKKLVIL